jgi:hypothetical protein
MLDLSRGGRRKKKKQQASLLDSLGSAGLPAPFI